MLKASEWGHASVIICGLNVLGRLIESKQLNIVGKCVQVYQRDKYGFELVFTSVIWEGNGGSNSPLLCLA